MGKGLLILMAVFAVIAVLNLTSSKLLKLEAVKKAKFTKLFWYFYSSFLILSGVVNCVEKSEITIIFTANIVLGIVTLVLNYLGKFDAKEPA